jgi:hypothetical protein
VLALPLSVRIRIFGLVVSSALALFVALSLLVDTHLFVAMHPIPLALAFFGIAVLSFVLAVWLWNHPEDAT